MHSSSTRESCVDLVETGYENVDQNKDAGVITECHLRSAN